MQHMPIFAFLQPSIFARFFERSGKKKERELRRLNCGLNPTCENEGWFELMDPDGYS